MFNLWQFRHLNEDTVTMSIKEGERKRYQCFKGAVYVILKLLQMEKCLIYQVWMCWNFHWLFHKMLHAKSAFWLPGELSLCSVSSLLIESIFGICIRSLWKQKKMAVLRHCFVENVNLRGRLESSQVKCLIPVIRENKIKYFAKSASTNKNKNSCMRPLLLWIQNQSGVPPITSYRLG